MTLATYRTVAAVRAADRHSLRRWGPGRSDGLSQSTRQSAEHGRGEWRGRELAHMGRGGNL